jgi:hypothetical protein
MPPSVASPPGRLDVLINALAVLGFMAMVLLSIFGLGALGWDYASSAGSPLTRFHPSTYIFVLAFLLVLIRDGNPLESFYDILRRDMRLALYVVAWLLLMFQILFVQGLVIGMGIDTYLVPLLLLVVFDRLDPATRRLLIHLAHAGFIANAALGLAEFLGGFRLTRIELLGTIEETEWRSSALFGHPLSNALMMGCYGIMLLVGGGRELPKMLKILAFVLVHFSMIAFGGRTSLVLLLLADALALGVWFMRFLAGGRVRLLYLALFGLALPLLPLVAMALLESGFFDKLLERFVSDAGSARTRIIMFEMFSRFSWTEILLGPPLDKVNYLTNVYGIEYGIESTWVAFVYYLGLLPSLLFLTGLLFLILALMGRCNPMAWFVLLYFFIINSTFLGIAGKTHALSFLFASLLILMPAMKTLPAARPSQRGALPQVAGVQRC